MTIQDLINELESLGSKVTQHVTGTQAQYDALTEKDEGTIYYITDKHVIYKGEQCYSGVKEITIETKNDTGTEGNNSYNKEDEYHLITISQSEEDDIVLRVKTIEAIDKIKENIYEAIQEVQDNLDTHIETIATDEISAHVKLSDKTDSNLDVSNGTAATPKAVSEALRLAKEYAEEQIAAGFEASDIQVLKGSVNSKGTINSEDATINGLHISTIANYKTGWSFKVTEKSEGSLWSDDENTKVEAGDTIIALRDYSGSNQTSDWFIVHNNLIGAVTTNSDDLTQDGLIIGDGKQKVKPLANGSNAQVITIVDGKPQWSDNVDTTYTFADGTDGSFNVTPKNGQTQKVSIGKPANAGHADTAAEADHATNADNADEAIHSETATLADDLGGKPETHEENFVYQPTAADLSIKDGFADIKKLKGNTLVWNQLDRTENGSVEYMGLTYLWDNGTLTINGQVTENVNFYGASWGYYMAKVGHKIYHKINISGDFVGSKESCVTHSLGGNISYFKLYLDSELKQIKGINPADTYTYFGLILHAGDIFTNVKIQSQLIDLTQMFGEGNEPATVEEFEAMFPNDYYEYNEGELMSFDGKGLKSVGFNQFNNKQNFESNTVYLWNDGYTKYSYNGFFSTVEFTRCLPNTQYYLKDIAVWWYDKDKVFIASTGGEQTKVVTSPPNAYYCRMGSVSLETSVFNLSHSGYRNGEYEPYEDYTLLFQDGKSISQMTGKLNGEDESVTIFPDGLKSAGEAYDEIVYDKSTGKHKAIKRIGSVDMGTLEWFETSSNDTNKKRFGSRFKDIKNLSSSNIKGNILTNKFVTLTADSTYLCINGISLHNNNVIIYDENYTTSTAVFFKTTLQGQILYYELAEPEVYELDNPINMSYEAYDFGTEEVLYTEDSEVNVPMSAEIEYGFNAVDMIRGNYFDIQKLKKGYLPNDGTAASAEKLATPRSFKISGGAESEAVEFDGTDDVNLNVTKVKSSVIDWEGVTNITDKNIVDTINYTSPSTSNIPNEVAVVEAVTGIIDLLTWKTL